MPACSVIVVNWNAADVLPACIESVFSQHLPEPAELIVVDNASDDGSLELLSRLAPRVKTIRNDENVGFSRACNVGARAASCEVLFFLNPDAVLLGQDTLGLLLGELRSPTVGIAAPKLLGADGALQPTCARFPAASGALITTTGANRLLPDRARARLAPTSWSHGWSIDADWVKGAAMAIRSTVFWRLGGFWRETFMYAEDLDLCYRVHRAGLRVRFVEPARVMHLDDYSADQRWTDGERIARSAWGELVFLRVHRSRAHAALIRALTVLGSAIRAVVLRLLGRAPRAQEYLTIAKVHLTGRAAG
jgi:GT2 family glycosyltransferase